MFGLGWMEIMVLGIIAVLLFGKRLPDMAKYLGKSVVEFKKGMHGLESGFEDLGNPTTTSTPSTPVSTHITASPPQRVAPAAPKFDDVPVNTHITSNPPQP